MMPAALAMMGIAKSYGRRAVLTDVELELAPGQRIAITGPNGSGKSTLLGLAATVLRPTAGSLHVAGHDARRDPVAARRSIGWCPQEPSLYPDLSPMEHMHWWASMHRVDSRQASDLLVEAGLAPVAQRPARALSGGQRRRLSLCLAFMHRPALLLLDEPFAGLDLDGRKWLGTRIEEHQGALLIAHHDALPPSIAHETRTMDEIGRATG